MTFSSHNSQLVAGLASGTTILQSCIFPLYPHRTLSWGTWAHHTWNLFTPNSAFLITHMWYHSSNSSTVIFLFLLQVFSKTITYSKVSIIQGNLSTECRNDLWRLLPSPVIAHFSPILESTHFPSHDTNCKKRQAISSWSFPHFICFSYKPEANMENSISVHFFLLYFLICFDKLSFGKQLSLSCMTLFLTTKTIRACFVSVLSILLSEVVIHFLFYQLFLWYIICAYETDPAHFFCATP